MSDEDQFEAVKRTCEQMGIDVTQFAAVLGGHLDAIALKRARDEAAKPKAKPKASEKGE